MHLFRLRIIVFYKYSNFPFLSFIVLAVLTLNSTKKNSNLKKLILNCTSPFDIIYITGLIVYYRTKVVSDEKAPAIRNWCSSTKAYNRCGRTVLRAVGRPTLHLNKTIIVYESDYYSLTVGYIHVIWEIFHVEHMVFSLPLSDNEV